MEQTETLKIIHYVDWEITYVFNDIIKSQSKEILCVLAIDMTIDKKREFESLAIDVQLDIVRTMLHNEQKENNIYNL